MDGELHLLTLRARAIAPQTYQQRGRGDRGGKALDCTVPDRVTALCTVTDSLAECHAAALWASGYEMTGPPIGGPGGAHAAGANPTLASEPSKE